MREVLILGVQTLIDGGHLEHAVVGDVRSRRAKVVEFLDDAHSADGPVVVNVRARAQHQQQGQAVFDVAASKQTKSSNQDSTNTDLLS